MFSPCWTRYGKQHLGKHLGLTFLPATPRRGKNLQASKVSSMSRAEQREAEQRIVITANERCERLRKQRDRATATIENLIDQIGELQDNARKGELAKKSEASGALNELKYWLRAARETEMELEAIIRKEEGIGDAYGLDLECARSAIRCRLDSLRTCCGEG